MIAALIAVLAIVIVAAATWHICWRYPQQNRGRPEEIPKPGAKKQNNLKKQSGPKPNNQPASVAAEPLEPVAGPNRTERSDCATCVQTCIQVAALIGLAVYCYFTYETWQGATEALHVTQRPWVSASGAEITKIYPPHAETKSSGHFDVDVAISLKNSGASIAIQGAAMTYIYPGFSGHSFTFVNPLGEGVTNGTLAAPFPGNFTQIAPVSIEEIWDKACPTADKFLANASKPDGLDSGFVLAPEASARYFETVPNNGVTLQNMQTNHFMVLGCISYRDGFTHQHHTRYCFVGRGGSDSDPSVKAELTDCANREFAD